MNCTGRLIRYLNKPVDEQMKVSKTRTHVGDARIVAKVEAMQNLKRKAEDTSMYGRNVIAKISANMDAATAATLPSTRMMLQTIRRTRKDADVEVMQNNLIDLVVPVRFHNVNDEQFLIYDSGPGNDRILIFATHQNLKYLIDVEVVLMDGTFNIVPPMFEQLYTLQGTSLHLSLRSEMQVYSIYRAH